MRLVTKQGGNKLDIVKRDGADIRPEYVNSFKAFSGNGEVCLEFSRVDLAATLETSTDGTDPKEMIVDVAGRFIFRHDQVAQLINTLVGAISAHTGQENKK